VTTTRPLIAFLAVEGWQSDPVGDSIEPRSVYGSSSLAIDCGEYQLLPVFVDPVLLARRVVLHTVSYLPPQQLLAMTSHAVTLSVLTIFVLTVIFYLIFIRW